MCLMSLLANAGAVNHTDRHEEAARAFMQGAQEKVNDPNIMAETYVYTTRVVYL